MQGVKAANSLLICTAHSQLGADLLRRTAEGEAQMRPSSPWDIPYDVYMPPPSPSGEVGRVGASGEVHLLTFSQHNNFRSLLSEVSLQLQTAFLLKAAGIAEGYAVHAVQIVESDDELKCVCVYKLQAAQVQVCM